MSVLVRLLPLAAWASLASSHAVILNAQGLPNSPASFGFQSMLTRLPLNTPPPPNTRTHDDHHHANPFVFLPSPTVVQSIPRNCTSISPCQQDATLIRDAEISANIVNECGRTELQGNIDIGENTENALAAKQVTQVQSSASVTITMHQVNADGAGPFNVSVSISQPIPREKFEYKRRTLSKYSHIHNATV